MWARRECFFLSSSFLFIIKSTDGISEFVKSDESPKMLSTVGMFWEDSYEMVKHSFNFSEISSTVGISMLSFCVKIASTEGISMLSRKSEIEPK